MPPARFDTMSAPAFNRSGASSTTRDGNSLAISGASSPTTSTALLKAVFIVGLIFSPNFLTDAVKFASFLSTS